MHKKILAAILSLSMIFTSVLPVYASPSAGTDASAGTVSEETSEIHDTADTAGNTGYTSDGELSVDSGMDSAENDSGLLKALEIPSAYNTDHSIDVTSVKNQNPYGDCWAFAALASGESNLLLNDSSLASNEPDLSEMQLGYYNFVRSSSSQPAGCEDDTVTTVNSNVGSILKIGGNFSEATFSLARWVGAANEAVAPQSEAASFAFDDSTMAYNSNSYVLKNADYISLSDIDSVKQEIMSKGAMAIGIGLYSNYLNTSTYAYYASRTVSQDHAVTVVGWDDGYSKTNFRTQPSSDGAWLCKNSYGTGWGLSGYFWVSYEDKSILFAGSDNAVSYQFTPADEAYTVHYQHDGGIYTKYFTYGDTLYTSNVFTASSQQELKAVSFFSKSYADQYDISVYTGVDDVPTSGSAVSASETSGTIGCAGYHTIDLNNSVFLEQGEKFAVVVKITNPSGAYGYYENSYNYSGYFSSSVSASQGESYYSSDGSSWTDMTDSGKSGAGNLRIKAFADDASVSVNVSRVSGNDRYKTAAAIAEKAFPVGSEKAILVSGDNFPDALSAAAYAGAQNCPILITENETLTGTTSDLMKTLGVKSVTIIGGTGAVSENTENMVKELNISTARIEGDDRIQTANAVYADGAEKGYFPASGACVIANGSRAADSLSMSPWSCKYRYPVFLTDDEGNLTAETLKLVKNFRKVYLLGQSGAVSLQTESQLAGRTDRIGGADRYETSLKIAQRFAGSGYQNTAFASGSDQSYADALTGSVLSASYGAPIILIDGTEGPVFDFIASAFKSSVTQLYVYGGKGVVTSATVSAIKKCFV
jgi:C1A family cysteine protease/putative cell wall-binding protein